MERVNIKEKDESWYCTNIFIKKHPTTHCDQLRVTASDNICRPDQNHLSNNVKYNILNDTDLPNFSSVNLTHSFPMHLFSTP